MSDELPALDVDPDLISFTGWSRWDGAGFSEEALEGRALAVADLARKIATLGPLDGTAMFDALVEQAELAGDRGGGVWVSDHLVPHLADPASWYAAATGAGSPLMARAALTQWFTISPDTVSADVLSAALDDARFRNGVISTVLRRGEDDEAAKFVVGAMQAEDAWLLDSLFIQDEPNKVLHLLLLHPVSEIASSAAIVFAIGQPHGPALPESWCSAWRDAVQHLRPRDLSHHDHWRVGQLLSHLADHDPDLLEAWYTERIDEMADCGYFVAPEPHECDLHLDRLPQEHRYRIAVRCVAMPRVGHSPLIQLIGPDRNLAERLLRDRSATPDNLLDALVGQRNETLEHLGPLLLSHGVPPARIAANVAWVDSWWGEDSARHHHLISYFTDLATRVPALASIATAGLAQQQELLQEAELKERAARVRGWQ